MKTNEKYSAEFWVLAAFMLFQQDALWLVQMMNTSDMRYIVMRDYLAFAAFVMIIIRIVLVIRRGYAFKKQQENKTTLTDYIRQSLKNAGAVKILLIVLAVLATLSTIFGVDPISSFAGRQNRFEGLCSLMCYYLLCRFAVELKSERERELLCYIFCAVGVITSVVGIICLYGLMPESINDVWGAMSAIPYVNPNYYASMISMIAAMSFGMFVYGKEKKLRIVGVVTFALAALPTFGCQSSSVYVGNIMMFLLFLFMETVVFLKNRPDRKKDYRRHLIAAAILLVIYIGAGAVVQAEDGTNAFWKEMREDREYASDGFFGDQMFSYRMIIWKFCFKWIQKYPVLGAGPDSLLYLTNTYEAAPYGVGGYDKAHNEYINVMISEGIPAAIIYIVFLFAIFIPGIKNWKKESDRFTSMGLFLAFFAYIAQAFFNISVIEVAPYFWIICGLAVGEKSPDADKTEAVI